jgi:hypothetical protein
MSETPCPSPKDAKRKKISRKDAKTQRKNAKKSKDKQANRPIPPGPHSHDESGESFSDPPRKRPKEPASRQALH